MQRQAHGASMTAEAEAAGHQGMQGRLTSCLAATCLPPQQAEHWATRCTEAAPWAPQPYLGCHPCCTHGASTTRVGPTCAASWPGACRGSGWGPCPGRRTRGAQGLSCERGQRVRAGCAPPCAPPCSQARRQRRRATWGGRARRARSPGCRPPQPLTHPHPS